MLIHKLQQKFVLMAMNRNGGPGGPPFKVNGLPVFPDPADEGNGKPELIDEEEKKVENEEVVNKEVVEEVQETKTEENDVEKDAILEKIFDFLVSDEALTALQEQESKKRHQEYVAGEEKKNELESIDNLLEELWKEQEAAYYAYSSEDEYADDSEDEYADDSEDEYADNSEVWVGTCVFVFGDGEHEIDVYISKYPYVELYSSYYLPDCDEDLDKYLPDLDLEDFDNTNNA